MFGKNRSPRTPQGRQRPQPRAREPLRREGPAEQNRAFSYYAARSQTELNVGRSAPVAQPTRERQRPFFRLVSTHKGVVLAGVVVLFALLYNLQLNASNPKVAALTTASDAPFLRETGIYEKAAAAILNSSAANRNKLTINASAVAAKLKQQFPELRDVSVTLPLIGSRPIIYIQPSSPAAIITGSSGTFVVDENGRALIAGSALSDTERFKVPAVTDQSRLNSKVGDAVIAGSTARFIQTTMQQLRAQQITVSRMVLPAATSELDVYIANKPYFIKFNLHDEQANAAELQTGSYIATASYLEGKGITPPTYIDVRLTGRAYYK